MFPELKRHALAYTLLVIGLLVGAAAFLLAWPDKTYLRLVILGIGVMYVTWGVLTHLKTKRITSLVVWEYVAMASIACVLLLLLTL